MTDEIKKAVEQKKIIIGTERSLKGLRQKTVKKVFISSNCPANIADDIKHLAKLASVEIVELNYPNDELGVICKKQFNISVVALPK